MYLSNLRIKNYRSIKELYLQFKKGKNIIVGKNNAGKSNIIKAIDLILGENTPAYNKTENITENDFHCGNIAEPIYIFCQLERDAGELINYNELYKCIGFYRHSKITGWNAVNGKSKPVKTAERHVINSDLKLFWNDLDAIINIDQDEDQIDKEYVSPKNQANHVLELEFEQHYQFAFAFRAEFCKGKVTKEIRLLYRENESHGWVLAFSAPIRTELIQSAIIPSFRDPSNILRIGQWSWYGRLLRGSIDNDNQDLRTAFDEVRTVSNTIFDTLKTSINDTGVKVAFPNTNISFQFNPDTNIDIYKSTLIYVDDGFKSLLQDKGSGIQSAVIIGLFHYYTRNISHISCSLLAVEEPELYLHPQARRVISHRLDDFLENGKNQVIITTHSPEFITTAHDKLNIILAKKTEQGDTVAFNTEFSDSKEKQILMKTQNTEMFFADDVFLVEGGEKYIFEAVTSYFGDVVHPELGKNWINDNNISILSVGGKSEFWKYRKKLSELKIRGYIIADFDFFLRQINEFLTETTQNQPLINRLNSLKGKIIQPTYSPSQKVEDLIKNLITEIGDSGYKLSKKDIFHKIKEEIKLKKITDIDSKYHNEIREIQIELEKIGVYFLDGELEDLYLQDAINGLKGISGKEEKPIYLVSNLITETNPITKMINCDKYIYFLEKYCEKVGLNKRWLIQREESSE